jgi:hypothetical protein
MDYAVEIDTGAIIVISSFRSIATGTLELIASIFIDTETHRQKDDLIRQILFSLNEDSYGLTDILFLRVY